MAFLLGGFGRISKSLNIEQLSAVVTSSNDNCSYVLTTDQAIIVAGNSNNQHTSDKVTRLTHDHGVFVGKIFDTQTGTTATLTSDTIQSILLQPHLFVKQFWGRYVGVLYDKKGATVTLIRDPLGLTTIFYAIGPDGILFSTELSFLYDIMGQKPALNWDYFVDHIINKNQVLSSTPFIGIEELLPGMALSINFDGIISRNHLWTINRDSLIEDKNTFEEELLATLKQCVKAWSDDSRGVCVELSGGTDSSSVMILLSHVLSKEKKIIGVNYIDHNTAHENEIVHARAVADACDVPLFFLDKSRHSLLDPLPASWCPNKPGGFLFFYNARQELENLIISQGCDEIMNGQGGDHVFLAPPLENSLADLWLSQGFTNFFHTLKQLSSFYRMPWWTLLHRNGKSVINYYLGKQATPATRHPYLNTPFGNHGSSEFYLNDMLRSFHPSKASQIELLYHGVSYAERNQVKRFMTHTHPLLSQPVVELALKIPTYQSFEDGYNRIFLRKAVNRVKNVNSIWRKTKGQATGSMTKVFGSHSREIRDIIAQGDLAKMGIINISWLDTQLVKINHGYCKNFWPAIHMLESQLWLNQWRYKIGSGS